MNFKTKTLLNLQSLEFTPEEVPKNKVHERLFRTIRRLRSGLSMQVLREYDFRKKRYGSRCVVPVRNGICTGCQIALSVRTRRMAKFRIMECEHCGRLLYNSERCRPLRLEVRAA
jgi:predicted  nucleic acid-binding Zn-ribbon protein